MTRWFSRSVRGKAPSPKGEGDLRDVGQGASSDDAGDAEGLSGDELPTSPSPAESDGERQGELDPALAHGQSRAGRKDGPIGSDLASADDAGQMSRIDIEATAPKREQSERAGREMKGARLPTAAKASDSLFVVGEGHRPFEPVAIHSTDDHLPAGSDASVAAARRRDLPYRPDTVADGWSTPAFTLRAASVRGYGHRRYGEPRQDDVAVIWDGHRVFAAVADGVSACPYSHLGASAAVRYAIRWLRENVPEDMAATDWPSLAEHAAWAVVKQAAAITGQHPDSAEAERLMATTLVAAVIEAAHEPDEPARAEIVGIGDSGAWLANTESLISVYGGKDLDAALASARVVGLPRVPEGLASVHVEVPVGSALLIATDGFADPLGDASGELGNLYRSRLFPPPSALEFAHMLDFSKLTFEDDRAMAAIWPRGDADGASR